MECPIHTRENADLLLAYCARKLDAHTAELFERHMKNCADCRALGDGQRAVWAALDLWEAMPVPPEFDRNLYARIEREERRGFWHRVIRPWLPADIHPALPLAIASVILMAAFLVQSPTSVPQPRVETVDADQVERALDDLDMLKQMPILPRVDAGGSQAM